MESAECDCEVAKGRRAAPCPDARSCCRGGVPIAVWPRVDLSEGTGGDSGLSSAAESRSNEPFSAVP